MSNDLDWNLYNRDRRPNLARKLFYIALFPTLVVLLDDTMKHYKHVA